MGSYHSSKSKMYSVFIPNKMKQALVDLVESGKYASQAEIVKKAVFKLLINEGKVMYIDGKELWLVKESEEDEDVQ